MSVHVDAALDLGDSRWSLGLTLVGYYHSHPDDAAIPSEYDRVHALPNFRYLITAVWAGQVTHGRDHFNALALTIEGV